MSDSQCQDLRTAKPIGEQERRDDDTDDEPGLKTGSLDTHRSALPGLDGKYIDSYWPRSEFDLASSRDALFSLTLLFANNAAGCFRCR